MAQKRKFSPSLPDHIADEIEKRAERLQTSPTEYLADIARWWFGQGSPAISPEEQRLEANSTRPSVQRAS